MLPSWWNRAEHRLCCQRVHPQSLAVCRLTSNAKSFRTIYGQCEPVASRKTWSGTRQNAAFSRVSHRAYATRSDKSKRERAKKMATTIQEHLAQTEIVHQLSEAVEKDNLSHAVLLYHKLQNKQLLKKYHVRSIAQCLHQHIRSLIYRPKWLQSGQEELIAFAQSLVDDVMKERIVPNGATNVHLITMLKEVGNHDVGIRFWKWLRARDDTTATVDVYGAAIELLAAADLPLAELEGLYQEALDRFPGNFNSYHLSPNAVLPDRAQRVNIGGLPMTLLQGIMTARLVHGDIKNAYLALDTALRILPDQLPRRFFAVFLEHRPLVEAFTIFAMACRCGIVLSSRQLSRLQERMAASSDLRSPLTHALLIRGMLSLVYLHHGNGGKINQPVLNSIIKIISSTTRLKGFRVSDTLIVTPHPGEKLSSEYALGVHESNSPQQAKVVDLLTQIIGKTIDVVSGLGITAGIAGFNHIIVNIGGFGRAKAVIEHMLADLAARDLKPNRTTRQAVITSAGFLKDGTMVLEAWKDLIIACANENRALAVRDFHVFVKAARMSNVADEAKQLVDNMVEVIPHEERQTIIELFSQNSPDEMAGQPLPHDLQYLDFSCLFTELDKIRMDLDHLDNRIKTHQTGEGFSRRRLPMTLLPPEDKGLSEGQMRSIYDQFTTEPGLAGSNSRPLDETSASPPNNVDLDDLRYSNWKSINFLLEQSDRERHYKQVVDAAFQEGTARPVRSETWKISSQDVKQTYGLHDAVQGSEAEDFGFSSAEPKSSVGASPEEVEEFGRYVRAMRTGKSSYGM